MSLQRFKDSKLNFTRFLVPVLAVPAALLLNPERADAALTYNIFNSGPNVVVETSGSLNLGSVDTLFNNVCLTNPQSVGFIQSNASFGNLCTGPNTGPVLQGFIITGPTAFSAGVVNQVGSSATGKTTWLGATRSAFFVDPTYMQNSPLISTATFNNTTLSSLGFSDSAIAAGLIGTWTINNTGDTIKVVLGAPANPVPAPLPLIGAASAFGWSRRLRKRIKSSKPEAVPPAVV